MIGPLNRELKAALPWLGAGFLWLGVVTPMRAEMESRLLEQGQIRRDRLRSERALREARALGARMGTALASACPVSSEPAALRRRVVDATVGLPVSPFGMSVTGGPGGGAVVEAEGARGVVLTLIRRLGDPARGGFLKSMSVRDKGFRWAASSTTGILDSWPSGVPKPSENCADKPLADTPEAMAMTKPATVETPRKPKPTATPRSGTQVSAAVPLASPVPTPPFTLVAFLTAEGKNRVSLRVDGLVLVASTGDQIGSWKCVSIDRDLGAVFVSAMGERLVLKPGQ